MCKDCSRATETQGHWRLFDSPKCIYCTARLIQKIARLKGCAVDELTARKRVVLDTALAWGHNEQAIRDLAASKEMAVAPLEVKRK
ncbi:MAG: hypothetical protein V4614_15020 [Pseudomonadota bacterium]